MPPGMMAPPGMAQFRVGDLVSVSEPDYDQLLRKETGGALNWQQYKQILHGKTLDQIRAGITTRQSQTTTNILEILSKETGLTLEELSQLSDEELWKLLKEYGLIS